ncbi:glycosyltransferase family 2 protein [uncultured Polaribacter sp.]|uniref:glycosyltransferase family 2 protein n=1 Tax=uncultured Polaribacter sp. TaxID=174711 RepID=UPI002637C7E3|nr:glycosyltransferase family 2 protein [uncultured Polaribacter sp.]
MSNNLVSIITPCFNSENFIAETIESVVNQTFKNWELIIVDDLSTDNSLQIINSYAKKDLRIKVHQLKNNSGTAIARNKAIELSKGNFIAFLDSDDLWIPSKLEHQLKFMLDNKLPLSYTSYKIMNANSIEIEKPIYCDSKMTYKKMLYSNKIGCLTAMYNKDIIGKIYMPNIRKRQDYGLWLFILKKYSHASGMRGIYASYRKTNNSISNNKIEMIKWNFKLFYEVEKFSFFRASYYTLCNVINKLFF